MPMRREAAVGFLTPLADHILWFLTAPSRVLLGSRISHQEPGSASKALTRAMKVDIYVVVCLVMGAVGYAIQFAPVPAAVRGFFVLLAGWRIVDMFATVLRVALFDHMRTRQRRMRIASRERIIVLGMANFVELIVAFGTIYAANQHLIHMIEAERDMFSPIYLSAITQLTVGYGDLRPLGWLRGVAAFQAFAGPVLIGLLIARYLGVLEPIEIHGGDGDPG